MKVGDLVKRAGSNKEAGLITDIVDKKCWRTDVLGKAINWGKVEPEPHAVVLIGDGYFTIPVADLEVVAVS